VQETLIKLYESIGARWPFGVCKWNCELGVMNLLCKCIYLVYEQCSHLTTLIVTLWASAPAYFCFFSDHVPTCG
jgi:hypothetical protein